MPKRRDLRTIQLVLAACVLAGLQACTDSQSPNPMDPTVLAAKPAASGAKVKVTEAIPSEAPQEVTLDVEVIGSGFDDGSVVEFLLAGQSTPKMVVNRSDFVSSKKLIANLTITTDAEIDLYDIEVTTKRGKKGIGSEMFLVKDKNAPSDIPVSATFGDAPGDGVTSDGGGGYDAVILAIGNLMLDARVDIPRQLCFDFTGQAGDPFGGAFCDDGYLTTADPELEGGLPAMTPGGTMTTRAQVTWVMQDANGKGYNWFLQFGQDCDSNDVPGDRLTVSHPDADSWTLQGTTAVLCRMPTKGKPAVQPVGTFTMPFTLTVLK